MCLLEGFDDSNGKGARDAGRDGCARHIRGLPDYCDARPCDVDNGKTAFASLEKPTVQGELSGRLNEGLENGVQSVFTTPCS